MIYYWHNLNPWNDSKAGIIELNKVLLLPAYLTAT